MKTWKQTMAICLTGTLLSSSVMWSNAYAAANTKGPQQLIAETKQMLFDNAYRIDKELIAYAESKESTNFTNENSSHAESSGGGAHPMKILSAGILGGLLTGISAPMLVSKLGLAGISALDAQIGGGILGGLLSAGLATGNRGVESSDSRSNTTNYNHNSSSRSETYQIHEQANTWAIVLLDKTGYKKARQAALNSNLANLNKCSKSGIQFLDSVIENTNVFSAEQYSKLSTNVNELNQMLMNEAEKSDRTGQESAALGKIERFMEQRIRVLRINYQDLVAGKNCESTSATDQLSALFNNVQKSSSLLNANSMAQAPKLSFEVAPYAKQSGLDELRLKASQARLAIYQAQTVDLLKDLTYIQLEKKTQNGKEYEMVVNRVPDALKRDLNVDRKRASYKSIGGAGIGFFGIMVVQSADDARRQGIASLGFASSAVGGALVLSAQFKEIDTDEQQTAKRAEFIAKQLQTDRTLETEINQKVTDTERLFNLSGNANYMKVRAESIRVYKGQVILTLANELATQKHSSGVFNTESYGEFLVRNGSLSAQALGEMEVIINFLGNSKIITNNINAYKLSLENAQALLETIQAVKAETKDEKALVRLNSMEKKLTAEVKLLELL